MADFFQVPFNVPLRAEPRNASGFTAPKIEVDPSDKLEIVGAEIADPVLTAKKWVKVKCAKGEGFVDRKLLTPFAALPPRPDEDLPIELRRAIEVEYLQSFALRTLCSSVPIPRSSSRLHSVRQDRMDPNNRKGLRQ